MRSKDGLWLPEWSTQIESNLTKRQFLMKLLAAGSILLAACGEQQLSDPEGYFINPTPNNSETTQPTIANVSGMINPLRLGEAAILALSYDNQNNLWLQGDVSDPFLDIIIPPYPNPNGLYPFSQPAGLLFIQPGNYTAYVVVAGHEGQQKAQEWFRVGSDSNNYPPFNKKDLAKSNMKLARFTAAIQYNKT